MNLHEFIEKSGSQKKAAKKLGISLRTLSRWLMGHFAPSRLALKNLEDCGIDLK